MIELLETVVSATFGVEGLSRVLWSLMPAAQALLLALTAVRLAWIGIEHAGPDGGLAELMADAGGVIIRAVILMWVLVSWPTLAALIWTQGPDLAARAVGSSVSPDQIAAKLLSLVARYSDAPSLSILGWLSVASRRSAGGSGPGGADDDSWLGFLDAIPSATDVALIIVSSLVVLVAQVVTGAAILMLAMPKLLLLVCLAIGPFAVAAFMSESQLAREFVEGWSETTATAALALPVMAILTVFMGGLSLPSPSVAAVIGQDKIILVDVIEMLANDVAVMLLIGQLLFMVLPISSGLIQGRVPSANSFMGLILSICTFLAKAPLRVIFLLRRVRGS